MFRIIKDRTYILIVFLSLSFWHFVRIRETVYIPIVSTLLNTGELIHFEFFVTITFLSLFLPLILYKVRESYKTSRRQKKYAIVVTTLISLFCFFGLPYFEALVSNVDIVTPKYAIYAHSLERYSLFVWLRLTLVMLFIGQISIDLSELIESKN